MRTCRGTVTVFLLAAIIMVALMIGDSGRAYAISHLVGFDHGSVGDVITDGGKLVKELGDGILSDDKSQEAGRHEGTGGAYDEGGQSITFTGGSRSGGKSENPGEGGKPAGDEISLSVRGNIEHTSDWNRNRERYNAYASKRGLAVRGENVFWPGEVLVLTAEVEGADNATVVAEFAETGYRKTLSGSGTVKKAEVPMKDIPGAMDMYSLTVRFTAEAGGVTAEASDSIDLDDSVDYWFLHRKEAP